MSSQRSNSQVLRSMHRARTVQLGMLPSPPRLDGVEIGAHYDACDELGGDFYDFVNLSPTEIGIVLADVSGHGVDAALLMAAAKKTLQIHGRRVPSPAEVLKLACEDLAADLPRNSFVTAWYGVLDLRKGLLRYASAGHNPFLLCRRGVVSSHNAKGVVLGASFAKVIRDVLEEATLQLEPGDRLLFYTDGVSEAADASGEQFGVKRLQEALAAVADGADDMPLLLRCIRTCVDEFRGGQPPDDDVTLLAVRFDGLRQATPQWQPRVRTNIKQRTDAFIGRDAELRTISEALTGDRRVVTLPGVAGIGKTRTAVEAARSLMEKFEGGVWFAALGECRDPEAVPGAIAQALELPLGGDRRMASLATALEMRGPTLLLLDAVENVASGLRGPVAELLALAPALRCLITSQVSVDVEGALEVPMRPLAMPDASLKRLSPNEARRYPALKLFEDRASRAAHGFELTQDVLRDVIKLCAVLDGLPLAIELAAGRMGTIRPGDVLEQLRKHRKTTRNLPPSVRALRQAIAWSFGNLETWEQAVLRQLSLFSGGFTLEAAEAVVRVPASGSGRTVAEAIERFLHSGLLWRDDTPYGARFNTFASLRGHMAALGEDADVIDFRARHYSYFAKWCKAQTDQSGGAQPFDAYERLELDRENLLAAHLAAVQDENAEDALLLLEGIASVKASSFSVDMTRRLCESMDTSGLNMSGPQRATVWFWMLTMSQSITLTPYLAKVVAEAKLLSRQLPDSREKGRLLLAVARIHHSRNEHNDTIEWCLRALEVFKKADIPMYVGVVSDLIGLAGGTEDRSAREWAHAAEKIYTEINSASRLATHRINEARILISELRLDEAEAGLQFGLRVVERIGNLDYEAVAHLQLGTIQQLRGDYEGALERFHNALRIARSAGYVHGTAEALSRLALLSLAVGDIDAARDAARNSLKVARLRDRPELLARPCLALGVIELEAGNYEAVREAVSIIIDDQGRTSPMLYSLLALAEMGLGHHARALELALKAESIAAAQADHTPRAIFYILSACARVMTKAGKTPEAKVMADRAHKFAAANGFDRHSNIEEVRMGYEMLDASVTARQAARIRVECAICGQRYMGTAARIDAIRKCVRCGLEPFTHVTTKK